MSIQRYEVDDDVGGYPHSDGRWCFAEDAIEAIAAKDAEIARLTAEVEQLRTRCGRYEQCLRRIADEDYRGNRSPSAVEAEQALKEPTDG